MCASAARVLPGVTWRPNDGDDAATLAGAMMVPVVGIEAAFQHAGQGSCADRWVGGGLLAVEAADVPVGCVAGLRQGSCKQLLILTCVD